ncbi:MAG: DUF2294 domain-containing protein [Syntrophomonadaceae bacterium]|nr:DUF2294 domain-containing protein [Syntrophomonadaceae bacterium]
MIPFKNPNDDQNGEKNHELLNDQQRRQMQHEFKIYMEKYFKQKLGKGVDRTKITIWEDMLIIRGEGFLTEPEKFIVETESGKDVVNAARMQVARQHSIDNLAYFEERLDAQAVHQVYQIEAEKDFWMHVVVFNRVLTL